MHNLKSYFTIVIINLILISAQLISQSIQWEQLSGPHGGAIYSIVKDNSGNIYANTMWGAGPFKSTDYGENWFSIKNGLTPNNGEFHPMNINSNGDLFIGGAHSTAILCRSTNGGNSWIPLSNLNTNGGSVFCISFDQANNIYVGTGNGIYISTNDGENWALYGNFTTQTEAIAFNDSGHVFAGTSYAVYRSTNDGADWTQLPTGGGTRTVAITSNGYIFAGCWENGGILRSTDNGDSWTYSYPQTALVKSASTPFFDENDYIYFPTWGKGVLFSSDYGNSWTEFNDGLGNKNVRTITKSNYAYLLAGGDYGIYKFNVYGWYRYWYSTGVPVCNVKKIAVDPYNYIFAAVWGINRSMNGGLNWETVNNGLNNLDVKAITIKNDGTIFCGVGGWTIGSVYRSTNNGNSWTLANAGIPTHEVAGLTVDDSDNVYVSNTYGVYKSTDNGDTWFNIGTPPGGNLAFNSIGDLFLASWGGGLWKLPAGDTTWVNLTSNIGASWIWTIFIGSNDYIYAAGKRSEDNGETWITMGYTGSHGASSYAENSHGHLFCGTMNFGSGAFRSTNYGDTWEAINEGFPMSGNYFDIRSIAIDDQDYLYAGTLNYSMFKTTTPTVTSVDDDRYTPISFSLYQNYPNPFNPATTIQFDISKTSFVSLKIYNLLGQEVATLVNENKNPGKYEINFDASTLPSGVYFYRLTSIEYISTKKLLLMR